MADVLIASVSNSRCQEMLEIPAITTSRGQFLGGPKGNGVVPCSLKRKRPPKIEIPNVLHDISPDIVKMREASTCFADNGVGVFSVKGKKKFMEDAHRVLSSADGDKVFFGVYDGHGGSKAAEFVTENLHLKIFEMLNHSSENKEREEAVKEGYLKTDEEFLKQGLGSGVCCLTALIEGQEMIISNLGDCRAVLCRDGIAEAITTDHKPGLEDERSRIQEKGGYVEFHRGAWRVHGTLAVSRSIGDSHLKDWVIAEPDTKVLSLTSDMEYLVLASDGLWEEVSNQEAVDIVTQLCSKKKAVKLSSPVKEVGSSFSSFSNSPRTTLLTKNTTFSHKARKACTYHQKTSRDEQYCENASPPSKSQRISLKKQKKIALNNENEFLGDMSSHDALLGACKELVNLAVARGSLDDITVMVVDLSYQMQKISPNRVVNSSHFGEWLRLR
ncbi:protein phosphatase 2c [Striga asiatica]|uniref:protein-serine/threonine phosphatase n=1 Tax=Striga asiatica TaxID=4170 RepID=A0A5A7NXV5_STRAF|nr:protein phosphatase 2c [Striga asiatica]